ncbi:hypothetical protein D3C71_20910 [compost metagenome]
MSHPKNFSLGSQLASLLSRGQAELEAAFNTLRTGAAGSALRVALSSGERAAATECCYAGGVFTFVAEEAGRRYEARLPLDVTSGQPVVLTLTEESVKGKSSTLTLSGADILNTDAIPEPFRELHERMLAVLRRAVPPELLAAMSGGAAKSKLDEAAPATPATDPGAPAAQSEAAAAPGSDGQAGVGEAPGSSPELLDIVVRRDNQPDLRFRGEKLAAVATSLLRGRQVRMHVFRSSGGKFVAVQEGLSLWPTEEPRIKVEVYDELAQVVSLFGYSDAAKQLYARLGLKTEEVLSD